MSLCSSAISFAAQRGLELLGRDIGERLGLGDRRIEV
jgi:hypothetical protein